MPSQFDFYEFYLEYDVELLVGLGVFVLTALVGWFASSRKKLQSRSRHPAASVAYGYGRTPPHGVRPPHVRRPSPQPKGPPADPFEQGGFGEVRAAVRRKGSVVRVAVANAQLEE